MKRLLILIMMLPILAFAQLEAADFKVTPEGRVIWQKVYENTGTSFDDLVNTVKANRIFSDINVSENKITCLATGMKTDPGALGFSRGGTQFYALGTINAYFIIDYKDGKYRITGSNITSAIPEIRLAPNMYYEDPNMYTQTPIEESVSNSKGLKKGFIKRESKIMGHAIERQFQIVKSTTGDNW